MHQLLFRAEKDFQEEYSIAREIWGDRVFTSRTAVTADSVVIGRYSVLPYYKELYTDLNFNRSGLINTPSQHQYIANMSWVQDLGDMTFPTWFSLEDFIRQSPDTSYVVKGRTNSRKFDWSTKMFAENKSRAVELYTELQSDPLLGPQGLAIRQFVPLQTYEIGINDMPMTNEWRVFFFNGTKVAHGFYWSIMDDMSVVDELDFLSRDGGLSTAYKAADKLDLPFIAIDVAKDREGKWWVVEINDGQMSGLSCIEPVEFYTVLKEICDA